MVPASRLYRYEQAVARFQVYLEPAKIPGGVVGEHEETRYIQIVGRAQASVCGYQVDGNENIFIETYLDNQREIREFFAMDGTEGRGLELVIDHNETNTDKWAKLVDFLGIDIPGGGWSLRNFFKSNDGQLWRNAEPIGLIWVKYRLLVAVLDRSLLLESL